MTMKQRIVAAIAAGALAFAMRRAFACSVDIGRAKSEVFVRSIGDGSIVGSLYKGDKVAITGKRGGWYRVRIGDKDYKVWAEYLKVTEGVCLDEVKIVTKVHKSKAAGKQVRGVTEHPIKGSAFDGLELF